MKNRNLLVVLLCMFEFGNIYAQKGEGTHPADTTIYWRNAVIEVAEKGKQYEVEIRKKKKEGDTIVLKQVFKGVYGDGYKNEKRVLDTHIELPVWDVFKRKVNYSKYWKIDIEEGGLAFSKLLIEGDGSLSVSNRSNRFSMKLVEAYFRKNKTSIFLSTSIDFNRIYFSNNTFLQMNEEGVTVPMKQSPELIVSRSKLRMAYFNMYAGLEYALLKKLDIKFYGGVKLLLSSYNKVTIENRGVSVLSGNENLSSVLPEFGFILQCYCVGFMFNYTPCSIFQKGKGPDMRMLTVGVAIPW